MEPSFPIVRHPSPGKRNPVLVSHPALRADFRRLLGAADSWQVLLPLFGNKAFTDAEVMELIERGWKQSTGLVLLYIPSAAREPYRANTVWVQ